VPIALVVGVLQLIPTATAGPPVGFELRTIVSGLEAPTALMYGRDGRLADGSATDFGSPSDWGGPTDIAVTPAGTLAYTAFLAGQVNEIVCVGGEEQTSFRVLPWLIVALGGLGLVLGLVWSVRSRRRLQA
jgi:hypothetical protein